MDSKDTHITKTKQVWKCRIVRKQANGKQNKAGIRLVPKMHTKKNAAFFIVG